jgi:hypothetical protein
MSAVTTVSKTSTKEPKETKPVKLDADGNPIVKAPRLPEKFGKFIQFGFWLLTRINTTQEGDDAAEPKIDEEDFINAISLYGTVDEQTAFVQAFFDDSKENKKSIRKLVTAHKKANEPKKERKPRVKKPKLDADGNEIVTAPKEPKPRAKKGAKAVANTQDELVDELVRRANSTDVPDTPAATPAEKPAEEKPAAKKPAAKPRAKKALATAEATVVQVETPAPVEETKTKTKTSAKTKAETKPKAESKTKAETKPKPKTKTAKKDAAPAPAPEPELQQDEDDDDDTDVSLFEFNGKQYYIDDNDVVYDVQTSNELGNFDRKNNKLNLN